MADYTLSAKITGDASSFTKAMDAAKSKMANLTQSINGVGDKVKDMGGKITKVGAGMTAGITLPFLAAVKSTMTFEDSMNKVRVTLLGGQKETDAFRSTFKNLQADALKLAAQFPVNAQEVADSMLELAKSGQDTNDIMDMMPGILSAASAAGENVATTSNTVSAAINGFGLEAKDAARVADILTNSANASKAGIADMGEVFKYAAPTAKTLGISIEELSAASGLMMDKGLAASQVGTSLTMALTRMVSPVKPAKKAMDSLGFSAVDSSGKFKSLAQIVEDLNKEMIDYTPAQKVATLSTIMGTEAGSKFLMLMDSGADKIRENTKAISERGTAEKTASEMQKSLAANVETMGGSFDALTKSIMGQNTPALTKLTQVVTGLLDKFNGLSDGAKSTIATFWGIAAAIGPILTTVGPLVAGFGNLVKLFGFLVSPIGLVVVALTALGALFMYQMSTNAKFAAAVKTMASEVVQALGTIKDVIGDLMSGNTQGATDLLSTLIPPAAAQTVIGVLTTVQAGISSFIAGATGLFSKFGPMILPALQAGFGQVSNAVQALMPVFQSIWDGIVNGASAFVGTMSSLFSTFSPMVVPALQAAFGKVATVVQSLTPVMQAAWDAIKNGISAFVSTAGGLFAQLAPQILPALQTAFGGIVNVIKGLLPVVQTVWDGIKGFFSGLVDGFTTSSTSIGPAITIITSLIGALSSPLGLVMGLVKMFGPQLTSIAQTVMSSLVPVLTALGTTIGQIASAVIPMLVEAFSALMPAITAVGTTVAAIVADVLPVVMDVVSQLLPVIGKIVSLIAQLISGLAPVVSMLIVQLMPVIENIIDAVMNIVSAVIPPLISIIQLIMTTVQALIPVITSIVTIVVSVVSSIISVLATIITFVANLIARIIAIISPIVSFVAGIIGGVISVITPIVARVSGVFSTVFSVISNVFSRVFNFVSKIFSGITKIITGITGTVSRVFNGISGTISNVMGRVGSVISGTFRGIQNAWNGLTGFVNGVFNGIGTAVNQLVRSVKGFVNGVIGGINGAIGLINKIPGVRIGKIPQLARGTDDFNGGAARINEGGRGEMVILPSGSQVIPHDVSMKAAKEQGRTAGRQSQIISLNQPTVSNNPQALNATFVLGGTSYNAFVDDISNSQSHTVQLKKQFSLKGR